MGHEWRQLQARYYTRGRRAPISLVVVHCTEGATAEGAARWFTNPAAGGSAHVVIDDAVAYRCVDDSDTAWHARNANSHGLGLEIVGFARWSRPEWLDHLPRLREAARVHAGWSRKYGLPLERSLTRGYHPHAGIPGNDHWDPGPGFPWDVYLDLVRGWLDEPTDPAPRPYGRSLRLILPNGRRFGGWTKDEVPAGYDGPAAGALAWLARQAPSGVRPGTLLTWRGGRFEDAPKLPAVAGTILHRFGGNR